MTMPCKHWPYCPVVERVQCICASGIGQPRAPLTGDSLREMEELRAWIRGLPEMPAYQWLLERSRQAGGKRASHSA